MQRGPSQATSTKPWALQPGEAPILGVTALGLAAATVLAIRRGEQEFLFYIAVLVLIAAAVMFVHRRVRLHPASLWCLVAWGVLHVCGGMVKMPQPTGVLYNWWIIPGRLKFDQFVHAYGFGVATWVCWQGLRSRLVRGGEAAPTAGMVLLSALAAMGLGAMNEVIEFTATRLAARTNVGGYENNAWDLVFNMTGSAIVAAVIWGCGQRRH